MLPHQKPIWAKLENLAALPEPNILGLFQADPDRLERFSPEVNGIRFDLSKLPISETDLSALLELADAAELAGWQQKLARGEVVNPSENRAATHMELRSEAGREGAEAIKTMAERIRNGDLGLVSHVIHIGIGGSALGPELLVDALGRGYDGPHIHVAANIDGIALERAFAKCDPAETLLIVVSKTFTTQETMTNFRSALQWLRENGVENPMQKVVAVTAAPERAREAGVTEVLPFAETVGGRYSLWSAVGLPLAVRCGGKVFQQLLDGAHILDQHFLNAPFQRNAPVLAALADIWSATFRRKSNRSVFAYDERLRLLPPYLQQLEMESNGKSVARDGTPLPFSTAAITWGGTGTDAQHAMFQLLHQGHYRAPIEFIAVVEPGHKLDGIHHRLLLSNCFAQAAALLNGRSREQALIEAKGEESLANAKFFPGNRGSSTILIDRLTPDRLGSLLAFYEARTFTAGVLMGINSFDQWGVELGKQVANQVAAGQGECFDPSTEALMQAAGL